MSGEDVLEADVVGPGCDDGGIRAETDRREPGPAMIEEAPDELGCPVRRGGRAPAVAGNQQLAVPGERSADLVRRLDDRGPRPPPRLDERFDRLLEAPIDFGQALGRPGDVMIGLSTSGRSPNLVRAFEKAHANGLRTIALLGGDGGELRAHADQVVLVPSKNTQHIQEAHDVIVHVLCELVEQRLVAAGWFKRQTGATKTGSVEPGGEHEVEAARPSAHRTAISRAPRPRTRTRTGVTS